MVATHNVLTIDGPSGVGKGTVSKLIAEKLGWHYLDSGVLYRAAALSVEKAGLLAADDDAIAQHVRSASVVLERQESGGMLVLVDGMDSTAQVRLESTGMAASRIAAIGAVRAALLELQRSFFKKPGLIADGRDMGTVVFYDAPYKVFLTARASVRARRRYEQLSQAGQSPCLAEITEQIESRDRLDSERGVSPLKAADDAIVVDSSSLGIDEVVSRILGSFGLGHEK
ncbi:cytidylate kinase [Parazoarcus communis]|uniref:Cytidylate kinase n=1 Tax=Parazoarcus communis TaxID=41977 RepID=A0A2U8H7I5_9RHOO|nr:(d)CMP kinase [Parazoarcus communis]AWI81664.1 cytidylate kinase [Parazoarcus communis]